MTTPHLLILGGTSEASALAQVVADAGVKAVFSYAGRVAKPADQPLPMRIGGFGGVDGLCDYLGENAVTHVVDATHPFAAGMSHNAAEACARMNLPMIALTRPAWSAGKGDDWTAVPDIDAAVAALDGPAKRVFLAIGKQNLAAFAAHSQHHYLLRLVDAPLDPLPLREYSVVLARGASSFTTDLALIKSHEIDVVVSKNSGGEAARAKLDAARELSLPVIMIERPAMPKRREVFGVDDVTHWLHEATDLGV